MYYWNTVTDETTFELPTQSAVVVVIGTLQKEEHEKVLKENEKKRLNKEKEQKKLQDIQEMKEREEAIPAASVVPNRARSVRSTRGISPLDKWRFLGTMPTK